MTVEYYSKGNGNAYLIFYWVLYLLYFVRFSMPVKKMKAAIEFLATAICAPRKNPSIPSLATINLHISYKPNHGGDMYLGD